MRDWFADDSDQPASPPAPGSRRKGWVTGAAVFPPDVSLEEIANFLDITTRQVTNLARDGTLPRASYGRYQFRECVRAYVRSLRNRANDLGDDILSKQRARLTKSRADVAEMERAQMMGELVPVKELIAAGTAIAAVVRTRVEAIPAKMANQLLNLKSPRDVEAILRPECDAALEEIAALEVHATADKSSRRRRGRARKLRAKETDDRIAMGGR